jgi:hypothetical protein
MYEALGPGDQVDVARGTDGAGTDDVAIGVNAGAAAVQPLSKTDVTIDATDAPGPGTHPTSGP